MNDREPTRHFADFRAPQEREAGERCWALLRQVHATRQPVKRERRVPLLALVALAAVGVLAGLAVSPAGSWIRDRIATQQETPRPGPARPQTTLPSPGRLLVASPSGIWVVAQNGGRRYLGDYRAASWSPRGLFVIAWRANQLAALEPTTTEQVRWSLTRRRVADARWSASGFRIAYRSGPDLRLVAGDGTGDRLLERHVAPVAPAWRLRAGHVLAYLDTAGTITVIDTDSRQILWRRPGPPRPVALAWSSDGNELLAVGQKQLRRYTFAGHRLPASELASHGSFTAVAARSHGQGYALTQLNPDGTQARLILLSGRQRRVLFAASGPIEGIAWSPNGDYLALGWAVADQWIFIEPDDADRLITRPGISRAFTRGPNSGGFPSIQGWANEKIG